MIKLNRRLACIASFCKDNMNIIDVGCDHAFLSIYIKQKYRNVRVLASDINKMPIESARNNLKKYNLEEEIELLVMDGIENMPDFIDTVIISGMGAILMTNIIKQEKLKNIETIILSPNNDYDIVRRYLTNNGYYIEDEDIILEKGKFYPIIVFKKGKRYYSDIEIKYGPVLIKNLNDTFVKFLEYKKCEYKKIMGSMDCNNPKTHEFDSEVSIINKILGLHND